MRRKFTARVAAVLAVTIVPEGAGDSLGAGGNNRSNFPALQ